VRSRAFAVGSTLAASALAACSLFTNTDDFNSYVEPAAADATANDAPVSLADDATAVPDDGSSSSDAARSLTADEYRALVMSDGPAAYWRLADVSGPTAKDETGSYAGTIVGTPDFGAQGPLTRGSTAMRFKGAERIAADSFVNATTASWKSATVEAWIASEVMVGVEGRIVEWRGKPPESEVSLFVDNASASTKAIVGNTTLVSTTVVVGAQWHHVALVATATSAAMYIDGVLEATQAAAFPALPTSGVFAIAADFDNPNDAGLVADMDESFKGRIAEVAVYDHALTPARIAAHASAR
jgi:hypothetical protein